MSGGIRAKSGLPLDAVTLDALREGAVAPMDVAISEAQLEAQAAAAEAAGYPQLAANLRRAAELTRMSSERVFEVYAMLRPGRASHAELLGLADALAADRMPRVAAFVREAAEAYRARGIVRADR